MKDIQQKFTDLIETHQGLIIKVCRMYADVADDRSDLFQEIVLQLWKAYPSFRGECKLSTWIYRVALNTAINYRRHENRHRTVDVEVPDEPLPDHSEDREKLRVLYQVAGTLAKIDKAVILLHLEGYCYDEISVMTGLSSSNVSTKISRIKKKIIDKMQKIYSQ